MKFISKNELSNITNNTITGNYTNISQFGSFNLFKNKNNSSDKFINKNQLIYEYCLSGNIDTLLFTYSESNKVSSAKNLLTNQYIPLDFLLNEASGSGYVELEKGDGIIPNSFYYFDGIDTYRDYSFSGSSSFNIMPYNKVGYVAKSSNPTSEVFGYIFYDVGIIWTVSDLCNSLTSWNSNINSLLKYTTSLEQNEHIYICNLNRNLTWNSSNTTYWTNIDKTNHTITSSLTSHWLNIGLANYTISSNSSDWIIIEEQNYPIYITGIGLYDNDNNLLAIAKLTKSQPAYNNFDMSFVVKLKF